MQKSILLIISVLIFNINGSEKITETATIPLVNMNIFYAGEVKLSDDDYTIARNPVIADNLEASFSSQASPILINGSLASVLLHFIQNPLDKSFASKGLTTIQSSMKKLNPSEWNFYVIYKPEAFVLFVPKNYSEITPETGINLTEITLFEKPQIPSVINQLKKTPHPNEKIAKTILKIFKPYDKSKPLAWNIIFFGHGYYSTRTSSSAVMQILKTGDYASIIAGIPLNQFTKIIEMLGNTIKLNVTVWTSCYGGGLNAKTIQDIIPFIEKLNPTFNPGILLSTAPTDQPICTEIPANYKTAFTLLNSIHRNSSSEPFIINTSIKALEALGFYDSGLIYVPTIGKFQPLKSKALIDEEIIYNIKDDYNEALTINSPLKTKIKLLAPGELSEITIKKIATTSFRSFIEKTIFNANELSPFFKILNISEFSCKISNSYLKRMLEISSNDPTDIITLHNIKIILFPEDLTCQGYILISSDETFPRKIIVLKKFKEIDNYIYESCETIINQTKFNKKIEQIISYGLLEKAFFSEKINVINDALHLMNERTSGTPNSFETLLQKYNISPAIPPNPDAIQNILINIAQNCKKGMNTLNKILNKKIILNQIAQLPRPMIKYLDDNCPDID